jgi:hypothetical protein
MYRNSLKRAPNPTFLAPKCSPEAPLSKGTTPTAPLPPVDPQNISKHTIHKKNKKIPKKNQKKFKTIATRSKQLQIRPINHQNDRTDPLFPTVPLSTNHCHPSSHNPPPTTHLPVPREVHDPLAEVEVEQVKHNLRGQKAPDGMGLNLASHLIIYIIFLINEGSQGSQNWLLIN